MLQFRSLDLQGDIPNLTLQQMHNRMTERLLRVAHLITFYEPVTWDCCYGDMDVKLVQELFARLLQIKKTGSPGERVRFRHIMNAGVMEWDRRKQVPGPGPGGKPELPLGTQRVLIKGTIDALRESDAPVVLFVDTGSLDFLALFVMRDFQALRLAFAKVFGTGARMLLWDRPNMQVRWGPHPPDRCQVANLLDPAMMDELRAHPKTALVFKSPALVAALDRLADSGDLGRWIGELSLEVQAAIKLCLAEATALLTTVRQKQTYIVRGCVVRGGSSA